MKTFLPTEAINQNYKYTINNDYIRVYTNNNCYTNYNSQYCDCYYIYPKIDYLKSENTSCNVSNLNNTISYSNFTDDMYYRVDIANIMLIFAIIFTFTVIIPMKIMTRIFGRWLKI